MLGLIILFAMIIILELGFLVTILYDYLNGKIPGFAATAFGSAVFLLTIFTVVVGNDLIHRIQDPVSQYHHNQCVEPAVPQSSLRSIFFQDAA
jgi:hypothetical protein